MHSPKPMDAPTPPHARNGVGTPDAATVVDATAALTTRYERQLLCGRGQQQLGSKVVPALVVTGFLGSGKTTLLQHLLAATQLHLGVLVNEVAALDIDGQLLATQSTNAAAAGVTPAALPRELAGGCACCSASSELQAALQQLAGSQSYAALDCLLLETSGVSDAGALADLLTGCGFRLHGVVAVLDAEAGAQQLQQHAVALAQLRASDVVVINKCDLASLAAVSELEDLVAALVPGLRVLRARFGQVPPEAFLDADSVGEQEQQEQEQQQQQQQRAQGEIAFLSHEPTVLGGRTRPKAGSLLSSARATRLAAAPSTPQQQQQQQQQQPGEHAHAHSSHSSHNSIGSVSFTCDAPLCMACFQACVAQHLLTARGLFRAKGLVWFECARALRYTFHLSGAQRASCGADGAWQCPPGVQLVLIGHDQPQLEQLKQRLQRCVAGSCSCAAPEPAEVLPAAATRLAELIQQHHRFELLQPPQEQQQQQGSCQDQLVQFSAVSSPLHGVFADEVNASVLRAANAAPGLFLCHIASPPGLRETSSQQQVAFQGVACLQLCVQQGARSSSDGTEGATARAEGQWRAFEAAVAPALTRAYQHVHNCKCDVVRAS